MPFECRNSWGQLRSLRQFLLLLACFNKGTRETVTALAFTKPTLHILLLEEKLTEAERRTFCVLSWQLSLCQTNCALVLTFSQLFLLEATIYFTKSVGSLSYMIPNESSTCSIRKLSKEILIFLYLHTHTHIHTYIHIYVGICTRFWNSPYLTQWITIILIIGCLKSALLHVIGPSYRPENFR